jgi:dolichyl-diphosphooligosaccharide--protein glycosyltransferase
MIARLHILDGCGTVTERKKNGKVLKFEIKPLTRFRLVYESATTDSSAFKEDIKMVKIFEYVKGAKIIGKVKGKKEVTISTTIKTNQGREFTYQQSIIANNGYFEFIVPYSTFGEKGWVSGQTRFSVFAKPYKLKVGDNEFDINISEDEVLEGKTIELKNVN